MRSNAAESNVTTLESRNVMVGSHRTSMRLEPEMWDALGEIAQREGITVHQLCSRVSTVRRQSSLTSAIRVVIVEYFRILATQATPPKSILDTIL